MNRVTLIRVLSVFGAVASAAALALSGDYVSAAGVISATFGSATVIAKE